jgi:2-octaprenyl-6-methoxyphenol hydroxylase
LVTDTVPANTPVLIVGAGLVGAAQALALASEGIASTVVDKALPEEVLQAGYDGRVSAISYASTKVLSGIGVWDALRADAGAIDSILVTEGGRYSDILFDASEIGSEPFGYMVPNMLLRRVLLQAVLDHPSITYLGGQAVSEVAVEGACVRATLESGDALTASLLVVADGRYSSVRDAIGIKARKFDYHQQAIVCTVRHAKPHKNRAVEWFFSEGPLAILPMQGGHTSAIVWTEEEAMASHLVALDADDFAYDLAQKLGGLLGDFSMEGKRYCYPLNLFQAEALTAARAVLIGDAAHAIHPIAGQGVNLGYRDVGVLTEVLGDAVRSGQDIGSSAVLSHYQQWRRFDATSMTATTDILNRVFSSDGKVVKHMRRAGMAVFGRTDPLKSFFMHAAMGMEGDLPRMLRD